MRGNHLPAPKGSDTLIYQRFLMEVAIAPLGAAILVLGYITFTCGARLGVSGLALALIAMDEKTKHLLEECDTIIQD